MHEQSRRHNTTSFVFLDLKLNSYPAMIRGIAIRIQDLVQGAEWIGTVHVDQRKDNALNVLPGHPLDIGFLVVDLNCALTQSNAFNLRYIGNECIFLKAGYR